MVLNVMFFFPVVKFEQLSISNSPL